MNQRLAHVALIIDEYDKAIAYYTEKWNFSLLEDSVLSPGKRWVLVAPRGSDGCSFLLARATTPEQESRIGNQTGGRVFLFLHTDDFQTDFNNLKKNQVELIRGPFTETYGTVAVFKDAYGNLWDLIEKAK